MKLTQMSLCLGLMVVIIACISALFSISQEIDIALAFYAFSSLMLIYLGKVLTGSYSNFTIIFLAFSAIYSLSGPISILYGGWVYDFYPTPYLVDEFLLHYSLAIIGLAMGLIFVASTTRSSNDAAMLTPAWNTEVLVLLSYAFAAAASLAEIVNFLRVGGLETLYLGKAVYQSAVSELPGTLPSFLIILLSTALLGLSLSTPNMKKKIWIRRLALWLIYSFPLVLSLVILGERSYLLSLIVVLTIGCLFFRPIKGIKFKWITFGILIYSAMAFLYGIRAYLGHVLITGDLNILWARISESSFWPTILNPASNDFGCVFGNFNTYIISEASDFRWGETYLRDMMVVIPRLIWPDKPQTIGFDFRDSYFPEWAQLGVGGGTAYSSILEAYVNFGTIGVPLVYLLLALSMGYLERIRSRSIFHAIFYLTILPAAITFHRSDFQNPIFFPLLLALVGSLAYILINSMFIKKYLN